VRNDRLDNCSYRCAPSCEVTGSPDELGAAFSASRASSTKLRSLLYRPPRIIFRGEMLPSMGLCSSNHRPTVRTSPLKYSATRLAIWDAIEDLRAAARGQRVLGALHAAAFPIKEPQIVVHEGHQPVFSLTSLIPTF
jgi:hypothetical protein